jgi:transposase
MSNFTNQFTKALCESQAQVVVIETLSIKNMMKNHKVARSFGDAAI